MESSARVPLSTLDVGGARLAHVDRGCGAPVVLVHGSNSDLFTWAPVADALCAHHRVIAYSRRYHWPNLPIGAGNDYPMPLHVVDLARVIGTLAVTPAHLIGHSYGALVCLLLAMRRPDLVRSLVLVEPPALRLVTSNDPRPGELLRLAWTRPRTAWAVLRFGARGVVPARRALARNDHDCALRHMALAVLGRDAFERLPPWRLEMARRNFIPAEITGSGFAALPDEQVQQVDKPTLLISGDDSPRLFHRLMDRLHELMPHAARARIEHASHVVHEDNSAAWLAAVQPFLRQQATRPAAAGAVFASGVAHVRAHR